MWWASVFRTSEKDSFTKEQATLTLTLNQIMQTVDITFPQSSLSFFLFCAQAGSQDHHHHSCDKCTHCRSLLGWHFISRSTQSKAYKQRKTLSSLENKVICFYFLLYFCFDLFRSSHTSVNKAWKVELTWLCQHNNCNEHWAYLTTDASIAEQWFRIIIPVDGKEKLYPVSCISECCTVTL